MQDFSETILATLARIRATNRNVNRQFPYRNLWIRRWELHHNNRLVALFAKKKVRRPNSWVWKGECRVWCGVDGFWKVFGAFLMLNFGFGGWDFARIEIVNAAFANIGLEGWFYEKYGFSTVEGSNIHQNVARAFPRKSILGTHKTWWCGNTISNSDSDSRMNKSLLASTMSQ